MCVYLQTKDMKQRDFGCHATEVGLGGAGAAQGVEKCFQTWSCGISN